MNFYRAVVCIAVCLLTCGCGKSSARKEITGKITLDGNPLDGVRIKFSPIGPTPGQGGDAVTDAEGKYTLRARRPIEGSPLVLPEGEYTVALSRLVTANGQALPADARPAETPAKESLPPEIVNPATSKLRARITLTETTFNFEVSRKD